MAEVHLRALCQASGCPRRVAVPLSANKARDMFDLVDSKHNEGVTTFARSLKQERLWRAKGRARDAP